MVLTIDTHYSIYSLHHFDSRIGHLETANGFQTDIYDFLKTVCSILQCTNVQIYGIGLCVV